MLQEKQQKKGLFRVSRASCLNSQRKQALSSALKNGFPTWSSYVDTGKKKKSERMWKMSKRHFWASNLGGWCLHFWILKRSWFIFSDLLQLIASFTKRLLFNFCFPRQGFVSESLLQSSVSAESTQTENHRYVLMQNNVFSYSNWKQNLSDIWADIINQLRWIWRYFLERFIPPLDISVVLSFEFWRSVQFPDTEFHEMQTHMKYCKMPPEVGPSWTASPAFFIPRHLVPGGNSLRIALGCNYLLQAHTGCIHSPLQQS